MAYKIWNMTLLGSALAHVLRILSDKSEICLWCTDPTFFIVYPFGLMLNWNIFMGLALDY